jgi:signal transduction histidine kinase
MGDPRHGDSQSRDSIETLGMDATVWQVAVVDDDEDVHEATALALRGLAIEGRQLHLLHAHSAAEAFALLAAHPGTAVALVDVVMETESAGLELVRRVRSELGRQSLRIVLRTGHPGYVPEMQTMLSHDINDYRTKAELTRARLFATLCTAIRGYRQLSELQGQRDEIAAMHAQLQRSTEAAARQAELRLLAEQALREAGDATAAEVEHRTRDLAQAVTQLEAFNRQVAHDLRGPLSGLSGLSGLMLDRLDRVDTNQLRQYLEMFQRQTTQLNTLVTDLLELARSNHGELRRASVPMSSLVGEAIQSLLLSWPQAASGLISVAELPTLPVDRGLMRQVFINLLGNALKFTAALPKPRIDVFAAIDGQTAKIVVRDNGPGFPADQASRLFTPFTRLHGAGYAGTGVGLSIVRRVVERHGGSVSAESAVGGGASFGVTLPLR